MSTQTDSIREEFNNIVDSSKDNVAEAIVNTLIDEDDFFSDKEEELYTLVNDELDTLLAEIKSKFKSAYVKRILEDGCHDDD